jgi:hypothetical protein
MAQKVHILLEDDLDGSEASETITFALDGTTYEIDLNEGNAKDLRSALSPYVTKGRKVANQNRRRSRGTPVDGHSPREIRDWARTNGMTVPDRGRVPAEVKEAFAAAH